MRQIYAVAIFCAIRFAVRWYCCCCCVVLCMFFRHHFHSAHARCLLCCALDFNLYYGFALPDDIINTHTHNKYSDNIFGQSMCNQLFPLSSMKFPNAASMRWLLSFDRVTSKWNSNQIYIGIAFTCLSLSLSLTLTHTHTISLCAVHRQIVFV